MMLSVYDVLETVEAGLGPKTLPRRRKNHAISLILPLLALITIYSLTSFTHRGFHDRYHQSRNVLEKREIAIPNRYKLIQEQQGHNPNQRINSTPGTKVISELSLPPPDYGTPVYTQKLMNYNFANSYGFVNNVPYTPPEVSFNKVVVNISTTSFGVQYDRLAHMYLQDVEVWRTSTAEPGGGDIFFSFFKDLLDYLSLFKEEGNLKFELGNIVNSDINGEFNVTLEASYYNYDGDLNALRDQITNDVFNFTDAAPFNVDFKKTPPTTVVPVVKPGTETGAPLLSLPDDSFSYNLVPVNKNTTRAVLRLYVTGNGNEEFWYTNILDPYSDHFEAEGNIFIGKGPIRVVKTEINGKLVSVDIPPPVIYTGGILPSLWSPVVGLKAFDIDHIDVDLTALLPELNSQNNTLDVTVFAGKQSDISAPEETVPEENWITTGSLLLWEDPSVKLVSGKASVTDPGPIVDVGLVETPSNSTLNQKAVYGLGAIIKSELDVQYNNGSKTLHSLRYLKSVALRNNQTYTDYGNNVSVSSDITSRSEIVMNDNTFFYIKSYQTVVNSTYTAETNGYRLGVDVIQGNLQTMSTPDGPTYLLTEHQNGTSLFYLDTENGNHGTGNTETGVDLQDYAIGIEYHANE